MFSFSSVVVANKGGPNLAAVDPLPCSMMKVCLCSRVGRTTTGSGNCPGGTLGPWPKRPACGSTAIVTVLWTSIEDDGVG
jgi:hypothetical protein